MRANTIRPYGEGMRIATSLSLLAMTGFWLVKEPRKSLPLAGEGAQCAQWADEVESHSFCMVFPEIITFMTVANRHFDAKISTDGNLFSN